MSGEAMVIGAGIGGLSAAVALSQRGYSVTVLEQATEIREVGAGIQISPNGLAVLRALGIEPTLDAFGAVQAEAVELRDYRKGAGVARLDLSRLKNQRYLFVHRADLIGALLKAAQRANVSIELDCKVQSIVPGQVSEVNLPDRASMRSGLLVCADGVHSVGRAAIENQIAPHFTGQVAWRATIQAHSPGNVVRVYMGPGRHLVCYPLRAGRLMNIVAVQERDVWAAEGWYHEDDPSALLEAFSDFGDPVQKLLSKVEQAHLWGLFRHPVATNWRRGNAVLLGDAAHPTLPFLAQGANMALEDAWVLAREVSEGAGLDAYQAQRKPRTTRIVDAASGNARKYHLHPGPVRWGAHKALSLGSRIVPEFMMRQFDWLYRHDVTQNAK